MSSKCNLFRRSAHGPSRRKATSDAARSRREPTVYKRLGLKRLAVNFCLFVIIVGCEKHNPNTSSIDLLKRGLSGEPTTLDPAATPDTFSLQVVEDVYEGLTSEAPDGSAMPAVATSWTIEKRGSRYTFILRPDARWSNGQPVRARDFVEAWRRVVDPKQKSPLADNLRLIAGASAIIAGKLRPEALGAYATGDNLLVVDLEHAAPYLPEVLAQSAAFPVYSDAAARAHSVSNWVSNGPYVLVKWRPGSGIELVRNSAYWDKANVNIEKVDYQFASDEGAQYARYRSGQLDLTDSVPSSELPGLRVSNPAELVLAPFLATAYYGFNYFTSQVGASPALRKALAMAIDRQRLVRAQGFGQTAAYAFVPPGTWNYRGQSWSWATLSDASRNAEAKRLYAQAGFSPTHPLRIRLLYNSNASIKRTAILIAAMWKETLGVETQMTEEEYRVFLQSRHDKSRWDVARLGWNADFNDASNFLDVLRADSSNNDMGYRNPLFDALLNQATTMVEPDKRRDALETAERVMLDDYPIIPLYFFVSKRLVKPYVKGVAPSPLDRVPSKSLTLLPH